MTTVDPRNETTRRRGRLAASAALIATALVLWLALHPVDPELPSSAFVVEEEPTVEPWGKQYWDRIRRSHETRDNLAKAAGGERVLRVLEAPDRGRAYLVSGRGFPVSVSDVKIVEGPIPIANDTLARLAKAFADPRSYSYGAGDYHATWHVRFQLEKGDDVVDVLICFPCSEMRISLADHRAKYMGIMALAWFAELAREMFPNDESLRKW